MLADSFCVSQPSFSGGNLLPSSRDDRSDMKDIRRVEARDEKQVH